MGDIRLVGCVSLRQFVIPIEPATKFVIPNELSEEESPNAAKSQTRSLRTSLRQDDKSRGKPG